MKRLEENDITTIPLSSYLNHYNLAQCTFTYYLQLISCQTAALVYIISFFLLKFKFKVQLKHLFSYHSCLLITYSIFILNNSISFIIDNIYFNWVLLNIIHFLFVFQCYQLTFGKGIYTSEIIFSIRFIVFYQVGFIIVTFPYPIPFNITPLQIGVLMLLITIYYLLIQNHIKQLLLFLTEKQMNEQLQFNLCIKNMEPIDLFDIYIRIKNLLYVEFVVCALIATLFECDIFIVGNERLKKMLHISIEILEVFFVYWFYFIMMRVDYLLYTERDVVIKENEDGNIELPHRLDKNNNKGEENEEDEDEDDNEEYYKE